MEFKLAVAFALLALTGRAQSPGAFTATGSMITPRFFHTATLLPDGRVLIAGGDGSYSPTTNAEDSAELYDPATGTFVATGSMTMPRDGHTATLLSNGTVLIAGGGPRINGAGYSLASAELYDPVSGAFTPTGSMTVERTFHTATLLNNGKVLIAGGLRRVVGAAPSDSSFPVSAELYDPDTGAFTATGDMNGPYCDSATLLADGRVLLTRRDPDNDPVSHAEIYDPTTGAFTPTGDATTGHTGPTATLLLNGKVLVAGGDIGDGDGASVSAELYDPATGTFTATGNLINGRDQNATALLPDGTVLFAGGHCNCVPAPGGGNDNLASAEIYNPDTGTFSATGSMLTGRDVLDATLLINGQVLITGGNEYYPCCAGGRDPFHPEVAVAELYTPSALLPPPALFSLAGDGRGQGAAGEALNVYLTGLADGSVIPPKVAIGGRRAEVPRFGKVPGHADLNQINVRLPSGVSPRSAVPVRVNYLGRPSNEVTIGLR